MLPSAFASLSDPCLPDFWVDQYTAAPGAIAMAAAIIIFLVEYGSTRYLAEVDRKIAEVAKHYNARPARESTSSDNTSTLDVESRPPRIKEEETSGAHFGHHHIHPAPIEGETDRQTAATQKLGVMILEAGIIFHSVFIGLTLAVSTGSNFISLFITIIFHRNPPSQKKKLPSTYLQSEHALTRLCRNIRRSSTGKSDRNTLLPPTRLATVRHGTSLCLYHPTWNRRRSWRACLLRSQFATGAYHVWCL